MVHVLLVTNLITPYRQVLYNAWADDCRQHGMRLHAAFMARGEPSRHWRPEDYPLNFDHHFYRGVHLPVPRQIRAKAVTHLNPGIWWDFLMGPWDAVVIGGYDSPTTQGLALLPACGTLKLLWSESNPLAARHTGAVGSFKHMVVDRFNGYVVPGALAQENILRLCPRAATRPFLRLPNVINDQAFRSARLLGKSQVAETKRRLGIGTDQRVLLYVGRLDGIKGILSFARVLADLDCQDLTLLVVGDGPDQPQLAEVADGAPVGRVRLLGYRPEAEVIELMALADGLVLPSMVDAWPLVLVEAAAVGLPLLCSTRVGNCADLVRPGVNGWVFDPLAQAEVSQAVRDFALAPAEQLARMGQVSAEVYDSTFRTGPVVRRFNASLQDLCRRRPPGPRSDRGPDGANDLPAGSVE